MRRELEFISQWIAPETSILDLGCGDGTLLTFLEAHRHVRGYGLEINPSNILSCLQKDVCVLQFDLDADWGRYFADQSFDYVVMTQTLQAVRHPDRLLAEMLRVGREVIVTFPNIGHWRSRLKLTLQGRMPVISALPDRWYDSPNIHLCTLRDFERLCEEQSIHIIERNVVDNTHRTSWLMRWIPNLFGQIAVYRLTNGNTSIPPDAAEQTA